MRLPSISQEPQSPIYEGRRSANVGLPSISQEPQSPIYEGRRSANAGLTPVPRNPKSLCPPPDNIGWLSMGPGTLGIGSQTLRCLAGMRSRCSADEVRYIANVAAVSFSIRDWLLRLFCKLKSILIEKRLGGLLPVLDQFTVFLNDYRPILQASNVDASDLVNDLVFSKIQIFATKFCEFVDAYTQSIFCDEEHKNRAIIVSRRFKTFLERIQNKEITDFRTLNIIADRLHKKIIDMVDILYNAVKPLYLQHYGVNTPFEPPSTEGALADVAIML